MFLYIMSILIHTGIDAFYGTLQLGKTDLLTAIKARVFFWHNDTIYIQKKQKKFHHLL